MGTTHKIAGQEVLWEARTFADDFHASQTSGGWFDLSCWHTVRISGPDAWDYLNRMSTVNFKNFRTANVAPGAFLNGKSVPLVWGYFLKTSEQEFLFVVPPGQGDLAYEHLEQFHFQENLQVQNVSSEYKALGIWQPAGAAAAAPWSVADTVPGTARLTSDFNGWSWKDPFRPALVWWLGDASGLKRRQEQLTAAHLPELGYRLFEFFRIDAGVVWVGRETTDKTLALQAGLDASISPQKGCYPGQETVERIRTYGRVNSLLSRVAVELGQNGQTPAVPVDLMDPQGKTTGQLVAVEVLPDDPSRAYGMAYVNRAYLDSAVSQRPVLSAQGQSALRVELRPT